MAIENRRFNRTEYEYENVYCTNFGYAGIGQTRHLGLLKCKLAHARGASVIVPDQLYLQSDTLLWIQPLSFTANVIAKVDDEDIRCFFHVDISMGQTVRVEFTHADLIQGYEDGSQLFTCTITGPADLSTFATGTAHREEGDLLLELYHHTAPETRPLIMQSKHLRGSAWNIRGNRELKNVAYAYFTCLDKIQTNGDLNQIAMASEGVIHLMRDDFLLPQLLFPGWERAFESDILCLSVYRESTANRTATLPFQVEATQLAPQHVLMHSPSGQPVYYEICCPFIHRVGLLPTAVAEFDPNSMRLTPASGGLKRFDYMVIGDARTVHGLAGPFEEEDTEEIFKVERVPSGATILSFWMDNANKDHFSGKEIDYQQFKPITD